MHRHDSVTVFSKLALLAAAGGLSVGLSACVGFVPHSAEGPYPKFSDIPLKAAPTISASQSDANTAALRNTATQLDAQAQGIAAAPSDADALAVAKAIAGQVPAPTDADAAAAEAFVRAARARATPPPVRK